MANALYNYARQSYLTATMDWLTIAAKAVLLDTTHYTFAATHQFYSSISGSAIVAGPVLITTPVAVDGAAGGDNITFSSVSGATVRAIGIFEDTGTPSTSRLIAYIDTATGLPITPNGGDIILQWDTGVNLIYRI
jgi:hypothetical protein